MPAELDKRARGRRHPGAAAARQLEAVTDTALAHLSLEALLDALLSRVRRILAVDTAAILLLDGETLVPRAATGLEGEVERGVRIPIGRGFAGQVAATKRPILVADVDHAEVMNPILREKGIRSLLGVPILFEATVIGVLHVGTRRPRRFRRADAQLLQVVADRVGMGISYARLYEEERRAHSQAEVEHGRSRFLADVSALLSTTLDYEATLRNLARMALPELGEWCVIDMCEAQAVPMRRVAVAHVDPARESLVWEIERRYPMRPEDPYSPAQVARTGQPVMVPEVSDAVRMAVACDAAHLAMLQELHITSFMCLPLLARGRTLGTVSLATGSGRQYTADDLALAEDLARRAALAVDNARLYCEAQESSRRRDEFLATISHELRTPLAPILAWTPLLRRGGLDPAAVTRALEAIERNAKSQARLIDDLLDVSRIVAGKLRLNVQPIQLGAVIETAIESMAPAAEAKGIRLESVLDPEAGPISGDPGRLQQVAWNLLSNAIKYTPRGGRVEARLKRAGSHVELTVTDTGEGIGPAFLPQLFERFRQADSSTTRAHGGLGLGLAVVRHLVELHGGAVRAESAGEGQGAVFTVTLPVRAPRGDLGDGTVLKARATSAGGDLARLDGRRVLVVDDEGDACEAMAVVLRKAGAEVRTCVSVADALATLKEWPPDVVVSDIAMPGEDGYALLRTLRAWEAQGSRRTPAVALTAYVRAEDRRKALRAGFAAHAAKPIEPDQLIAVVARVLSGGTKNPGTRRG